MIRRCAPYTAIALTGAILVAAGQLMADDYTSPPGWPVVEPNSFNNGSYCYPAGNCDDDNNYCRTKYTNCTLDGTSTGVTFFVRYMLRPYGTCGRYTGLDKTHTCTDFNPFACEITQNYTDNINGCTNLICYKIVNVDGGAACDPSEN